MSAFRDMLFINDTRMTTQLPCMSRCRRPTEMSHGWVCRSRRKGAKKSKYFEGKAEHVALGESHEKGRGRGGLFKAGQRPITERSAVLTCVNATLRKSDCCVQSSRKSCNSRTTVQNKAVVSPVMAVYVYRIVKY